jgi:excisionase family DNA binding protein
MEGIESRFLTIKEFCRYMHIGETKARELIRQHNKIALNVGGKWLIDKTKLDKWIELNLV